MQGCAKVKTPKPIRQQPFDIRRKAQETNPSDIRGTRRRSGKLLFLRIVLFRTDIAAVGVHSHGNRGSESRYLGLEDYFMHRIDRYIGSLLLAAAIAAPTAIIAGPRPQEAAV